MSYRGTSCSRVKSEGEATLSCLPVQTEVVCTEVAKALGLILTQHQVEANGGTFPQNVFAKVQRKQFTIMAQNPRLSWLCFCFQRQQNALTAVGLCSGHNFTALEINFPLRMNHSCPCNFLQRKQLKPL